MYDEILVPTDGSPEIDDAIAEALDLAAFTGGRVHAVSVVDTREYSTLSDAKWLTIERDGAEEGEHAISNVRERANGAFRRKPNSSGDCRTRRYWRTRTTTELTSSWWEPTDEAVSSTS